MHQSRARALFDQLESLPLRDAKRSHIAGEDIIEKAVVLIDELSQYRSWISILYLSSYLLNSHNEIEKAAIKAVLKVLSSLRPSDLLQMDDHFRHGRSHYFGIYQDRWDAITFSDLERWKTRPVPFEIFGLASCHRDGFVREAALAHLATCPPEQIENNIPYLIIRTGDWVDEVRTIAMNTIERLIEPENMDRFLPCLEVIHRMSLKERAAGLERRRFLLKLIEKLLKSPENRSLLIKGLNSKSQKDYLVRRRCLALLEEIEDRSSSETDAVISLIIEDSDINIRLAITRLTENLETEHRVPILKKIAEHGSSTERREALRILFDLSQDGGKDLAVKALTDHSASVRNLARWRLATLAPDFDCNTFYKGVLLNEPGRLEAASAIVGIGETGTKEDTAIIEKYTSSNDRALKKAAIKSLGKLDANKYLDRFVALLAAEDAGVSRETRQVLASQARLLNPKQLAEIAFSSPHSHVKRNALYLLSKSEKWERFINCIRALDDEDEAIAERAKGFLQQWQRDFQTTWSCNLPDEDQQTRLLEVYRNNKDRLHYSVAEIAEACLKLCDQEL